MATGIVSLGMYTVCTYELVRIMDLRFLAVIPHYFVYLSFLAWVTTAIGLGRVISSINAET